MDISEDYIKMCEKAEKIQKECVPQKNDIIQTTYWNDSRNLKDRDIFTIFEYESILRFDIEDYLFPIDILGDCFTRVSKGENIVWLPRQDQLQTIMFNYLGDDDLFVLESMFHCFLLDSDEINLKLYVQQFYSMNQLWLAFVIKEKYNKIWNGEDWV